MVLGLISLCSVLGMPDPQSGAAVGFANGFVGPASGAGVIKTIEDIVSKRDEAAIEKEYNCRKFGCQNNKCWAYCSGAFRDKSSPEWCYTSKENYSQSYKYVECTQDSDCDGCWKCAGPCSVI